MSQFESIEQWQLRTGKKPTKGDFLATGKNISHRDKHKRYVKRNGKLVKVSRKTSL